MLDKSRSVRDALRAAKSGPTRPVVPAKRKHFDDGGGANPRGMFDPELGWVGGGGDQTEGAASTGPAVGPQPFQMAALDVQQTQAAPMQQPSPTVDLTQQLTQVAANQTPQAPQAPQPSTDQGPNWKTWWGYTPTQTDYDKMLKLSLGEAGVNTYDQYRGVYEAMGNRHASGAYGGDTIADLITPKQTAGITQTSRINDLMTSTDPTKQKAYQTAKQALDDYLSEGQNKVLTTQTDWRGFQNNKPSPGTGFENKYIPGGTETGYQYNTFYDPEKNPALADKLAGMLAEKGGIKTYNPYTPTYAQDVLGKEAQLAAAEDMGPTFTQQAALDTQSQQDAINAAQQAATQQAQNFDTGIVQNAATDFNYLNPLQGTGIGDFTNMYTGVDYTTPTQDAYTPSVTDFSYNAFDSTPSWSWTPERRGGRTYAVGGPAPYVPPRKESWTDRTNKELQKEILSPEKEDEASEYYQKWQSEQSPQQKRQLARGGYATDGMVDDDLLARKQESMDPRKALMFGETDQAIPPAGLPIGQAVGTKAAVDAAKGLVDASDLTRQAMQGELPPDYFQSDEGIGRALGAAGLGMSGGLAGVPTRAGETVLGAGPIKKTLEPTPKPVYKTQEEWPSHQWVEKIYAKHDPWPYSRDRQFAVPYNFNEKGEATSFANAALIPHDPNTAYIDWLQAYPQRQGVGSQLLNQLKQSAAEDNIKLLLRPWDKGQVSKAALTRLYKRHGFKPQKSGSMLYDPNENRGGRIGIGNSISYPLDKDRDDKLTYMKPKEFLKKARPLNMDKDDKKVIKGFKHSIEKGHKLDPLALYPHNRENGRHRALAAKELGIKKVPVHNYRKEADGGSIVDKALMLTSRRLAAAKAPK